MFFKLPDDGRVSVIETRRTAFDTQGRPVRLTVTVYPADRNKFAINVGQVPPDVDDPRAADRDRPERRLTVRRATNQPRTPIHMTTPAGGTTQVAARLASGVVAAGVLAGDAVRRSAWCPRACYRQYP